MDFMLCSVALVICLALQVSSQRSPRPIGEWHPDRYEMYPNPWVNSNECKTSETSGLCDYNQILTVDERKYFVEQPEMKKVSNADGCLCNKDCGARIRITVTVALMKKIGPQITDYRAAATEFAERFRSAWNLPKCTAIVIASKGDNLCFVDAGSDVINLLSANVTGQIDRDINNIYCSRGLFVEAINAMLNEYRNALGVAGATPQTPRLTSAQTPTLTTAPTSKSSIDWYFISLSLAAVLVVFFVIIIVLVVALCIRIKKKLSGTPYPDL